MPTSTCGDTPCINDVTARDLQRDHKQWLLGKSLDTHCPMGPYAVTADEIGDVGTLEVETLVNGEQRQHAPVKDLIFDIPTLIATISAGITLLPGDIIATGTPAGVGIGFDPPKFLVSGDVVEVSISRIGDAAQPDRLNRTAPNPEESSCASAPARPGTWPSRSRAADRRS